MMRVDINNKLTEPDTGNSEYTVNHVGTLLMHAVVLVPDNKICKHLFNNATLTINSMCQPSNE